MALVTIEEEYLYAIADAIRDKVGPTVKTPIQRPIGYTMISKTPNATSLTTFSGEYPASMSKFDVVKFPGAAQIRVRMAYQSESTNYDYVQVMAGEVTTASGTKYGGSTRKEVELTFNDEAVTFYFKSDGSSSNYLGYYAEVTGYDASGNQIQAYEEDILREYDTYKPREMSGVIMDIRSHVAPSVENLNVFYGSDYETQLAQVNNNARSVSNSVKYGSEYETQTTNVVRTTPNVTITEEV